MSDGAVILFNTDIIYIREMFEYKLIKIAWLGHDGFRIESGGKIMESERDAEEFRRLAACDVVILKKEE